MIQAAARDSQSARWGLAEIERELELLLTALQAPQSIRSPELVAEEFACRSYALRDYVWNDDSSEAFRDSPTGLRVSVRGDLNNEELALNIQYIDTGRRDRAKLGKYAGDAAASLAEQFQASGWRIASRSSSYADFSVAVTIAATTALQNLDRLANGLDDAVGRLKFE